MSVGGELMMRAIFDAMAGAVFLSDHGDGCPLLDAAALPPVRLARRPVGGVIRRDGLTTFAPPLDLARRGADCRRLAQALPIFIDAVADDAARLNKKILEGFGGGATLNPHDRTSRMAVGWASAHHGPSVG